jgi:hypothetical protein
MTYDSLNEKDWQFSTPFSDGPHDQERRPVRLSEKKPCLHRHVPSGDIYARFQAPGKRIQKDHSWDWSDVGGAWPDDRGAAADPQSRKGTRHPWKKLNASGLPGYCFFERGRGLSDGQATAP